MRILVTGGAGFIGSHLVDALLSRGDSVVVVDDMSLGRKANIAQALKNPHCTLEEIDILTPAFDAVFKHTHFDAVIHLAANSDIARSRADPSIDKERTFATTFAVLEAMRQHNIKQIIFASTSAIYGDTTVPATEDHGPLLPASHYGAGKLASEAFISSYVENYGLQAWITRFPNVVGSRATHGVIYDFVRKLNANPHSLEVLGNGEQFKPYIHVKDLVEAILFIWTHTSAPRNIYNIGVEGQTKVSEIARLTIAQTKTPATIAYTGGSRGWVGDVPAFSYDCSKLTALGWKAKRTSTQAVSLAIAEIVPEQLHVQKNEKTEHSQE